MKIILLSVGSLMLIATLLPLLRNEKWWIRGFDFPRLQVVFISAIVWIVYLPYTLEPGLADKLFLAALLAAILHQCYMMYPYTFLHPTQVQKSKNPAAETNISFLFANVQMENRNSEKLKEVIREKDPDIILAAEIDEWWQDQLSEFEQAYSYTIQHPQNNCYGMGLYSKLELVDSEIKFLVEDDIPSIHVKAELQSGEEVELRCLHPRPPFKNGDDTSTERDAELLIVGKEIKDKDTPTLVLGDLNDVAWSHTNNLFQKISGLLDPRVGRGFYNTFDARYFFIRFPLDHIFHTNHFRLVDFKRLPFIGSDHFPVYIKLNYEPDAGIHQREKESSKPEHEEANEKIEKGT